MEVEKITRLKTKIKIECGERYAVIRVKDNKFISCHYKLLNKVYDYVDWCFMRRVTDILLDETNAY